MVHLCRLDKADQATVVEDPGVAYLQLSKDRTNMSLIRSHMLGAG